MTLHVIIHIKSVLNKDQANNYYYNIFLEKCSYQKINLKYKNNDKMILNSIIVLRFGERKVAKEKFYDAKNL